MNRFEYFFLSMLMFLFIVLLSCGLLVITAKMNLLEKQLTELQQHTKESEELQDQQIRVLDGQVQFFIQGGWK